MIRVFGFALKLTFVIALALWLADRPGSAHIVWRDTVIDMSAAMLALAVLALGYAFYLMFRLWHLLRFGPERWRLSRKLRRLRQGHDNLTEGFNAIASGDAAEAGRLAVSARKQLGTVALVQLLQAKAAQLADDEIAAHLLYESLTQTPAGAAMGYRGLIDNAQRCGKPAEAERLAAEMRSKTPDAPWLQLFAFEQATSRQAWIEAQTALMALAPTRLIDAERYKKCRTALLLIQGRAAALRGDGQAALAAAEQAARQSPRWLPALIDYAAAQSAAGHQRSAIRLIEKQWSREAHPQLAEIYRTGFTDVIEAYRATEKLAARGGDEVTNGMALAAAAYAAGLWGEARRHVQSLIERGHATAEVYAMMAVLNQRDGLDEASANALNRAAATAPTGKSWVCSTCSVSTPYAWQPGCHSCGSFATLDWREPRGVDMAASRSIIPIES